MPACLLIALAGCQKVSSVPVSDMDQAHTLLTQALQSWKDGKSVEELRTSTPPIYVADESWTPSNRLAGFTIERPGEMYATNVRYRVTLRVTGKDGQQREEDVRYLVTTTPALTISKVDR
jgi:hypothetical protein